MKWLNVKLKKANTARIWRRTRSTGNWRTKIGNHADFINEHMIYLPFSRFHFQKYNLTILLHCFLFPLKIHIHKFPKPFQNLNAEHLLTWPHTPSLPPLKITSFWTIYQEEHLGSVTNVREADESNKIVRWFYPVRILIADEKVSFRCHFVKRSLVNNTYFYMWTYFFKTCQHLLKHKFRNVAKSPPLLAAIKRSFNSFNLAHMRVRCENSIHAYIGNRNNLDSRLQYFSGQNL